MHVCIKAKSQSDALAFTVATVLKYSLENVPRTLIIENADTYRDFLNEKTSLIIVTNVLENPNYAVSKGHTVIWCGTPADKLSYAGKLTLPIVDREGFRNSLKICGLDDNIISRLMQETKRESALLRRALGINCKKETWMLPDNNKYYIPAILLSYWDETRNGVKDIVSKMAEMNPINAKSFQLIELQAFAYCLLSISLSESFDFSKGTFFRKHQDKIFLLFIR